jgi:hypothetical protein
MPPHITGNAIGQGMKQGFAKISEISLGTELIYSFVIIACSLMIYFATKELYELSQNKGLKYLRLAFLYFALAYFFRSFIKFFTKYFDITRLIEIDPRIIYYNIGQITLLIFMYFSAMAILCLLYSVIHKKWNKFPKIIYVLHALAIIIAISTVVFKNPLIHLTINLILLVSIIFTFQVSKKQKNKKTKNNLHTIYTLMIAFWIINILDILIPSFFKTFQLLIYISSLSVFLAMLYKVLRKTG